MMPRIARPMVEANTSNRRRDRERLRKEYQRLTTQQQGMGQPGPSSRAMPPAGTSMLQTWMNAGPWMGNPKTITSLQASPEPSGWRMKIIQSLDRKTKMYEPDYSEAFDEDEPEKIVILQGKYQRCKNGRKSIRPMKQSKMKEDLTADKSF